MNYTKDEINAELILRIVNTELYYYQFEITPVNELSNLVDEIAYAENLNDEDYNASFIADEVLGKLIESEVNNE